MFLATTLMVSRSYASNFNPESAKFSQISTLKTWVADHHQNNQDIMGAIQTNVAHSTPENLQSRTLQQEVINNPGEERYFGKTFPSITDVELAFLQEVKRKGQEKHVNSLEIAAGSGLVSWKPLFAFSNAYGGTHHANELSQVMIDTRMKPMLRDVFSDSYPPAHYDGDHPR